MRKVAAALHVTGALVALVAALKAAREEFSKEFESEKD